MAEVEEDRRSTLVSPRRAKSPDSTPSPRAHSPHSSSPNTTVTTPDQSPGNDDDIWDTSSDHEHGPHATALTGGGSDFPAQSSTDTSSHGQGGAAGIRREVILSDVPSLRRQHMTDGYREGLSVGKARVMQSGFDAGYPLGVEVGLRVGKVLGILEGVVSALTTKPARSSGKLVGEAGSGSSTATVTVTSSSTSPPGIQAPQYGVVDRDEPQTPTSSSAGPRDDDLTFVRNLYARAQRELKISELLKGLDDEKIAAIPDASTINHTSDGDNGGGVEHKHAERAATAAPPLPMEIEVVLVKWERSVLGALRKND
ncbi:hypothetical protein AYO20_00502 [Fonsecaea nubica]|uniref:Protein YAE1 n=1 Tax=Fonsecaea nubica TaxID=856822 RepID=A0A178DFH1_9EURO|nr:hypothetical protein AYO20_00502 [Fonsecaea nubica]OAL40084.1 hypothetical protein AYO20_00502 [Fonsecaea nubica]